MGTTGLLQGYYYRVTTTGLLQGYRGESPEWIYALELEKDRRFPFARWWRSDALGGFQRPQSRLRPGWRHYVTPKARPAEQAVRSALCVPGCATAGTWKIRLLTAVQNSPPAPAAAAR